MPPPGSKRFTRKKQPQTLAVIHQAQCTGCEACITVCPVDCIVKIPNPALPELNPICRVDWDRCTGCTICARDCPWETIDMVYPNQPDIATRIERYSLAEYGDRFIPEPEQESAA
jgi:electron transport complex protein RnfB